LEAHVKNTITIKGARLHNLKNISLSIPKNRLILTGLSGSGKSPLAFDTLHKEGQRQYVESLGWEWLTFLSTSPLAPAPRAPGWERPARRT
jgi:excinuclease UvrABC ATPase subunit